MESTAAAPVVQTTVSDHIALVTISNPPVNALSAAVRQGWKKPSPSSTATQTSMPS